MANVGRVEVRNLGEPDEVVTYPLGRNEQVRLAGMVISRDVHQPGWSWEQHVRPIVGTESCQFHHRGLVLSGRMGVRTDEGVEFIVGPNEVFDVAPGHVGWVVGDDEMVTIDWAGGAGWASPPAEGERVLATILFTDIVGSTQLARQVGDARWRRLLALHDDTVRTVAANFRGREIDTAGDSFLIVFDGAARAVRCGLALVASLAAVDVPIRVGIHTGEVTYARDNIQGLAVNAAARVMARAAPGEVLVSGTTHELAEGSDLTFESRGRHALRGLDGERELFAVTSVGSA
jgi:class 3 adenylate cyclase